MSMRSFRRETEMITSPSKISTQSKQSQVVTATNSRTNSRLSQTPMTRRKAKVMTKRRDAVELPNSRRAKAVCLTLYSRLMATMTTVVQIRGELTVLMTLMVKSIWTRSHTIQSYMLIIKQRCRSNSQIVRIKRSKDNR